MMVFLFRSSFPLPKILAYSAKSIPGGYSNGRDKSLSMSFSGAGTRYQNNFWTLLLVLVIISGFISGQHHLHICWRIINNVWLFCITLLYRIIFCRTWKRQMLCRCSISFASRQLTPFLCQNFVAFCFESHNFSSTFLLNILTTHNNCNITVICCWW